MILPHNRKRGVYETLIELKSRLKLFPKHPPGTSKICLKRKRGTAHNEGTEIRSYIGDKETINTHLRTTFLPT